MKIVNSLEHLTEYFPLLLLLLFARIFHEEFLQGLAIAVLHRDVHNLDAMIRASTRSFLEGNGKRALVLTLLIFG